MSTQQFVIFKYFKSWGLQQFHDCCSVAHETLQTYNYQQTLQSKSRSFVVPWRVTGLLPKMGPSRANITTSSKI